MSDLSPLCASRRTPLTPADLWIHALVQRLYDACVADLACRTEVVAIQIPTKTVTMPPTRFQLSGSWSRTAPTSAAATGLTVTEIATRVGVVRASANAQR